jgi:glycosyltransferase involved in cell wall biosynthesis
VRLSDLINRIKPDLIHAMRIPFEGMMLSLVETNVPRLISIWGNDFTLHAKSTPIMMKYTKRVLKAMNGLHADCHRDVRIAHQLGYKKTMPNIVLPGNGGVQIGLFHPAEPAIQDQKFADLQDKQMVPLENYNISHLRVINPRGYRAYVRNDVFFNAIPTVLAKYPEVEFLCPSMEYITSAKKLVKKLGISESVKLMPKLSRNQMADLYRTCRIFVSPSTHDGTPNTLLEAMASGCFPIVGDIESIREWIEPGVNGILFQPLDPEELANGILTAINSDDLYNSAMIKNLKLIKERAEYLSVMNKAEGFYRKMVYGGN